MLDVDKEKCLRILWKQNAADIFVRAFVSLERKKEGPTEVLTVLNLISF